jgi:2-dehydropantoate 2-reductase
VQNNHHIDRWLESDPNNRYNPAQRVAIGHTTWHPDARLSRPPTNEFCILRYAILGSGAVGGLYGSMMARHGHEVHFLLHSDYDHVKEYGLRIDSKNGDFHLPSPNVYRSVDDMPRCDVVVLAMKSTNNHLLSEYLPKVICDGGAVLTLQNGLDVEADCVSALARAGGSGAHEIFGGCCFLCSNKVGPGHIHHLDYGRIVFGRYQHEAMVAATDVGQQILADMQQSGIDANWTDDLAATRWRKLMWNIPFNGLSVSLNASTDAIMDCPPAKALADALIREVHCGAAVCGVTVDEEAISQTMHHTETMVPYDSSMRLDYLAGRSMEVKAIFSNPLQAVAVACKANGSGSAGDSITVSQVMPRVEMLCQTLQFLNTRPTADSRPISPSD